MLHTIWDFRKFKTCIYDEALASGPNNNFINIQYLIWRTHTAQAHYSFRLKGPWYAARKILIENIIINPELFFVLHQLTLTWNRWLIRHIKGVSR